MKRAVGHYKQYPEWVKGPAWIEDGHIVLDEERATRYFVYEPTDLVFDLLDLYRLDNLDARDVISFVRRYGLLYHGGQDSGSGRCREPLDQWHEDLANLNLVARLYMGLIESVENSPTEEMRQTFEFLDVPKDYEPTDKERLEAVSVTLAEWITEGMEGTRAGLASTCSLDVEPKGPATFLLLQRPANLLTAAYSQFAFLVANKAPMLNCPGCGRLFLPKSGKQKNCTPSCASTNRWRKWKERQAE